MPTVPQAPSPHTLVSLAVLCWLALPLVVHAAPTFTGRVVGISDGDTVSVLREGKAVKVRLYGIDTPEKKQPFGTQARQAASALAFQQEVTVTVKATDRYGRLVGEVRLPDGQSLNAAMVAAGMAWWYRPYAPNETMLAALQAEAQAAKRGLWADAHPVAPWDWRNEQRLRAACARLKKAA